MTDQPEASLVCVEHEERETAEKAMRSRQSEVQARSLGSTCALLAERGRGACRDPRNPTADGGAPDVVRPDQGLAVACTDDRASAKGESRSETRPVIPVPQANAGAPERELRCCLPSSIP